MDKNQLNQCLELIKTADTAYLTTIDENGFPCTRAMLNLRNRQQFPRLATFLDQFDDDLSLFFTTNTSSIKFGQIKNNDKVAIYYCNPQSWHGLMFQGNIEIVTDTKITHSLWLEDWIMYYPDGKDSEDYTILKLKPSFVKSYFQFQRFEHKL